MWMRNRKRQGLIAASIYAELNPIEQEELKQLTARDPSAATELEALNKLAKVIPLDTPELPFDLRAGVKARLLTAPQRAPRRAVLARQYVLVGAAAAFVIGLVTFGWLETGKTPSVEKFNAATPVTLMQAALDKADSLVAENQPAKACALLNDAVTAYPKDPLAGKAQLRVADLSFDLHRYPDANAAYTKVAQLYSNDLKNDPALYRHVFTRRDLLEESQKAGFESLYALDNARNDRIDEFGRLEDVVGHYQNSLVAEEAVVEMGRVLLAETPGSESGIKRTLDAMKKARERCKSSVAVALLDLKIGDIYKNDLNDTATAEIQYKRAAENSVVAMRAQSALEHLHSP